ncbi:HAD family phosphatase [Leucobacter sp. UCMA 4100]|uniref:HAD family hydrolase n=1 Tax=Leucobacter sp. UCMA 4100 TaxID=2810534 RepID=UPI0022EB3C2B|nr:HAD family phosphatase [Leucobacter sp. UCMA 4100]MDA3146985.1 HAD family phosphatase [Leucobacter sp. UCMA 4100]
MTETAVIPSVKDLVSRAKALLLDFNGTLSDDEEVLAELVCEISDRELGVPLTRERYFSDFAGFTEENMFAVLLEEAGLTTPTPYELLQVFNAAYLERTAAQSTITADAHRFVTEARAGGKHVMVVTAASQDVVVPALKQAGLLDLLDGVIALEDVDSPKPAPDAYLQALKHLSLTAADAVAFEDSRTGIAAATGAGLTTIGIIGSLDETTLQSLTPHTAHELHPAML